MGSFCSACGQRLQPIPTPAIGDFVRWYTADGLQLGVVVDGKTAYAVGKNYPELAGPLADTLLVTGLTDPIRGYPIRVPLSRMEVVHGFIHVDTPNTTYTRHSS